MVNRLSLECLIGGTLTGRPITNKNQQDFLKTRRARTNHSGKVWESSGLGAAGVLHSPREKAYETSGPTYRQAIFLIHSWYLHLQSPCLCAWLSMGKSLSQLHGQVSPSFCPEKTSKSWQHTICWNES